MYVSMMLLSTLLVGCNNKSELLASPTPELLAQIEPYTQPAIEFAQKNEHVALKSGIELSASEKSTAKKIGIKNVDKIRILYVNNFPFPENEMLAELASDVGLDSPMMAGFTYGYGIYIRKGSYDRELVAHELIHVKQYEMMGIEGFMNQYLLELAVMGYRSAPLEVEAYNNAGNY